LNLAPSLRTGRADFPHPALRSVACIRIGSLFATRDFRGRAAQVFHLPDFIYQAEPLTSFDSSFEGCQHAFVPHACFGPRPLGRDVSALFSRWHWRQLELQWCVLHASTFLPPLGSTGISRFVAPAGTLTPAPLSPTRVSLVTRRALPDMLSPTTPCAPACRRCFVFRAGLAPDSLCIAIGGASDFVRYSQSHQSHEAESSLCRGARGSLCSTACPFTVRCSPPRVATMQLLPVTGGGGAARPRTPNR